MDLKLSSLRADRPRRYTFPGLRIDDHTEDLVLLVVWTGASKAYQEAITNQAFQKLEGDEAGAALIRLLAQHIIIGWDGVPLAPQDCKAPDVAGQPLAYTAERGAKILQALEADQRPDLRNHFLAFVTHGANFQRSLVDAGDLGNG